MSAEGHLVKEGSVTWANNDAVNTAKNIDTGTDGSDGDDYEIIVRNPSTVTALKVSVRTKELALGGADRFPEKESFTVAVNQPEGVTLIVRGWEIASQPGRLVLSNNTVLGAADGFTADVRVRKIA